MNVIISVYEFPRLTLCFPLHVCRPPSPPRTCMHDVTYLHTHVQNGKTALILALENKHEEAAAELMEPIKLAGALEVAHEAW